MEFVMGYTTVNVDVDVDLSEFDTDDLIEELEGRGVCFDGTGKELVEKIYSLRRLGKTFDAELDQLLYVSLGKVL
jgi:hypothetical protein